MSSWTLARNCNASQGRSVRRDRVEVQPDEIYASRKGENMEEQCQRGDYAVFSNGNFRMFAPSTP